MLSPPKETLTSLTSGASEPWRTLTDAIIGGARSPIFTVAGKGAVGAPASLSTHAVTVDTCNDAHSKAEREAGRVGRHLCSGRSETGNKVMVSKLTYLRQR